jgi:very-short-patch-repair endonuclease
MSGLKFRRQCPVGPFIADFYCDECRLVIELDGGQHTDQAAADQRRTSYFESRAIMVLRFWNNDVLTNTDGVLERVAEVAAGRR